MDVKHYANIGKEREVIREQIEEIRKCHFTLGQEKVEYKSDTHQQEQTERNIKETHTIITTLETEATRQ